MNSRKSVDVPRGTRANNDNGNSEGDSSAIDPPDYSTDVLLGYQRQKCEVWTRVMGYYRPVDSWNIGKKQEFHDRKYYKCEVNDEQDYAHIDEDVQPQSMDSNSDVEDDSG